MAKALLMESNDYADYDYDDLESDTMVWYAFDELDGQEDTCNECGQTLKDGELHYMSSEDETRCENCVEIIALSDLVRAWHEVHALRDDMQYCDENCNRCPVTLHPNSRMLTYILNKLHDTFGNGVYKIVQAACPNFTICYDCRIDDFGHVEGCKLIDT